MCVLESQPCHSAGGCKQESDWGQETIQKANAVLQKWCYRSSVKRGMVSTQDGVEGMNRESLEEVDVLRLSDGVAEGHKRWRS